MWVLLDSLSIVQFYFSMPLSHLTTPYHLDYDPTYEVGSSDSIVNYFSVMIDWMNSNILVGVRIHIIFTISQIQTISHLKCRRCYCLQFKLTCSAFLLLCMVSRNSSKEYYYQMSMFLIEITRSLWFWLTNYQMMEHPI